MWLLPFHAGEAATLTQLVTIASHVWQIPVGLCDDCRCREAVHHKNVGPISSRNRCRPTARLVSCDWAGQRRNTLSPWFPRLKLTVQLTFSFCTLKRKIRKVFLRNDSTVQEYKAYPTGHAVDLHTVCLSDQHVAVWMYKCETKQETGDRELQPVPVADVSQYIVVVSALPTPSTNETVQVVRQKSYRTCLVVY